MRSGIHTNTPTVSGDPPSHIRDKAATRSSLRWDSKRSEASAGLVADHVNDLAAISRELANLPGTYLKT